MRNVARTAARNVVVCLASLTVLTCSSCSNQGGSEPLYPVTGKVTYRGSPAWGAVVSFRQSGRASKEPIMGFVQKNGSFEMESGPLGPGAPAGDYDVLIEWKRYIAPGNRRPQAHPDLLQGRFADLKHPLFHAKIHAGSNELPPFELANATGR